MKKLCGTMSLVVWIALGACSNKEKMDNLEFLQSQTRASLKAGNVEQAQAMVDRIKQLSPDFPSIRILQAQIDERTRQLTMSPKSPAYIPDNDPCSPFPKDPVATREQIIKLGGPTATYSFEKFYGVVYEGDMMMTCLYLGSGMDVNSTEPHSGSALVAAAKNNKLDVARLLISRQANPNLGIDKDVLGAWQNVNNTAGFTALMFAVNSGNLEMTRLLLGAGADVSAVSFDGQTALSIAEKMNRPDLADAIKEFSAEPQG